MHLHYCQYPRQNLPDFVADVGIVTIAGIEGYGFNIMIDGDIQRPLAVGGLRDNGKTVQLKYVMRSQDGVQCSETCVVTVNFLGRNPILQQVTTDCGGFVIKGGAVVATDQYVINFARVEQFNGGVDPETIMVIKAALARVFAGTKQNAHLSVGQGIQVGVEGATGGSADQKVAQQRQHQDADYQ